MKLEDYVFLMPNFLDKDFCKQTVKQLQKVKWQEHLFYNNVESKYENKSGHQELDISFDEIPNKKIIMKKLYTAILQYIQDIKSQVFTEWSGYTNIRFNKYDKNKKMAIHCDHIHSIFDGTIKGVPILSIIGMLNDNFTGGEFFINETNIKLKEGDLLMFPSSFIYPHQVKPLTKGMRYSYVSWVY
tara:strand:- start:600 stop:1157 length:558 start_codon:yes stop_codon:yes gene_type:complete